MATCASAMRQLAASLDEAWQGGQPSTSPAQHDVTCAPLPAQPSLQTGLVSVSLCRNDTHGLVVAAFSNATDRVVLLRVGGPHPQTVIFERAGAGQVAGAAPLARWVAPFRSCTFGTYTMHVLFLTLDPWGQNEYDFARRCNIHHTPEAVLVRNASIEAGLRSQPHAARVACRTCLWSWRSATKDWEARSLFSGFATMPHPYRFDMPRRFGELRFANPRLLPSRTWWREAPARSLPLCLIGDSHMRNLANQLSMTNRSDCDALAMQDSKAVCNHSASLISYFRANEYAGVFQLAKRQKSASKLQRCGAILMSFGQWQVSDERSAHGMLPYSPPRFVAKLRPVLAWLRKFGQQRGIPVAWMTLNPMPLTKGLLTNYAVSEGVVVRQKLPSFVKRGSKTVLCPPTHWCMPHTLHRMNSLARTAALAARVTLIDTWHVVFPLLDTAFDGAHFGLPTALPVTLLVRDWLRASHCGCVGVAHEGLAVAGTPGPDCPACGQHVR